MSISILKIDWAFSFFYKKPTLEVIISKAPATIELVIVTALILIVVSIPAGVYAAIYPKSWFSRIVMAVSTIGVAIPVFLTAIAFIYFFSVELGWLPSYGRGETVNIWGWESGFFTWDGLKHLILPAFSLGLASSATLTRQLRSSVITVMQQDYVRTARAKGLRTRKIVFKHVLKNASIPAVTALGLQIPLLLSGTVIIEGLFGLNGIGQYAVSAVLLRDLPVVQGVVMVSAVIVVVSNLLVDISYGYLNPKTRQG